MDEERTPSAAADQDDPRPAIADLWTVALLVFFVSLVGIVAALLILPALGS